MLYSELIGPFYGFLGLINPISPIGGLFQTFLYALASLDFKLSQSDSPFPNVQIVNDNQ